MPLVQQAGGSLTTAAVLTLLAWGVRMLRKDGKASLLPGVHEGQPLQGRFFSTLSAAALRMLVCFLLLDLNQFNSVSQMRSSMYVNSEAASCHADVPCLDLEGTRNLNPIMLVISEEI